MRCDLSSAILRAVPGAFILNAGVGHLKLTEDEAAGLQKAAEKGVPAVAEMSAEDFGRFLAYGEIAVGAAMLLLFVPNRVAGAALGTFSAGLVASYLRTPGMTEPDGIRPIPQGIPIAKDTWLAAIAAALLIRG